MYVACLMAGVSSRLLPLTRDDHKALLNLGSQHIIDVQMKIFSLAALGTFSFVVGHGGRRLTDHLRANYSALPLSIINNEHFASRNLDWSAYLALSSRQDDVLYYEGDIIAEPSILRDVAMHPGDVCIAMDPKGQSARIDTRVIADKDRVRELVFSEHGDLAKIDSGTTEGEFLCLVKLSNRAREYVVDRLERASYEGPMQLYEILNDLFRRVPSFVVSTDGRPWVEIDNREDLLRAGDVVTQILGAAAPAQ